MNWLKKISSIIGINKGLGLITVANIISSILGALFWLFLASILLPDKYGELSYLIAIGTVMGTVAISGGDITIVRLAANGRIVAKNQLISFVLLTTLIVSISTLFLSKNISLTSQIFGTAFFSIAYSELLGYKLYNTYAKIWIGQKIVQILLGLSLYFVMGIDGVIYGYGISYLVFSYKYFFTLKKFTIKFTELKGEFKFMVHNLGVLLSRTLVLYSDKLLIGPLYGYHILGLYQITAQLMMIISVMPVIIFDYLLSQEASGINREKVKTYGIVVSVILAVIMLLTTPYMIAEFFPNFKNSINAMQIISLSIIPLTYSAITTSKLLGSGKSKPVFMGAIIFLVTQYVFIIVLGRMIGLEGIAASSVIGLSAQATYLYQINRTHGKYF